jgi:nucleoside-diphosphate-sugar epimerase
MEWSFCEPTILTRRRQMRSSSAMIESPVRARVKPPASEAELEDLLSEPPQYLLEAWSKLPGDILVLGAGGKMGLPLCRMAKRAAQTCGTAGRVVAASRFSDASVASRLQEHGVEVVQGDLLNRKFVCSLPKLPLVVAMTGQKFGTSSGAWRTWMTNTYLPAITCEHFADSRIAAYSTGNVYGYVAVSEGQGKLEESELTPVGEYGMAALGRERIYEHYSRECGMRTSIIRLNYAVEMRYGLLVDIAARVKARKPIPLAMGYANVIWEADACAAGLASLTYAASPPFVLNVTGPEVLSCRAVAQRFGELFGVPVEFEGQEAAEALLSDASKAMELFGRPRFSPDLLMDWIAEWMVKGGKQWDKPTHYENTSGQF